MPPDPTSPGSRPASRRSPPRWASSTSWALPGLALHLPLPATSAAPSGCSRSTAPDVVAANNGRVVKFIGDEVMFRVVDPAAACRIALEIVERFSDDAVLPGVRAAIASAPSSCRDGDYFGPTVNLAARAHEARCAGRGRRHRRGPSCGARSRRDRLRGHGGSASSRASTNAVTLYTVTTTSQ